MSPSTADQTERAESETIIQLEKKVGRKDAS
jgi:hypothetical protein